MRLDKYLKVSRIIKRRTLANEACDHGRVSVNGKTARASYNVKPDDIINIKLGENGHEYKVLAVENSVKKEFAGEMFTKLK